MRSAHAAADPGAPRLLQTLAHTSHPFLQCSVTILYPPEALTRTVLHLLFCSPPTRVVDPHVVRHAAVRHPLCAVGHRHQVRQVQRQRVHGGGGHSGAAWRAAGVARGGEVGWGGLRWVRRADWFGKEEEERGRDKEGWCVGRRGEAAWPGVGQGSCRVAGHRRAAGVWAGGGTTCGWCCPHRKRGGHVAPSLSLSKFTYRIWARAFAALLASRAAMVTFAPSRASVRAVS